jgi:hypothetical protein
MAAYVMHSSSLGTLLSWVEQRVEKPFDIPIGKSTNFKNI